MAFSNDIISRAQSDLQRAEKDAANAREKLQRSEMEINDLRAFLRKLEHYAAPTDAKASSPATRSPRGSGGKAKRIVSHCIDLIQNSGRKMPMNELFPRVIADGIEIGGTDEKSVLAGYLSRDERVYFERGFGWGIVETEGVADLLAGAATPSLNDGGQNERTTLTFDPAVRT
jgi:hypothetical protein